MANQELLDYIMRQRAHGANAINIKDALLKAGWDQNDVEAGIAATEPTSAQPTVTPPPIFAPNTAPIVSTPLAASPVPLSSPTPNTSVMPSTPMASMMQSQSALPREPVAQMHPMQPTVPVAQVTPPVFSMPDHAAEPTITPLSNASSIAPMSAPVENMNMHIGVMPTVNPAASPSGTPAATATKLPGAGMVAPGTQILPPMAAMPSVQIPSANFMPKSEPAYAAPPVASVTNVMPAAVPAASKRSSTGLVITIILIVLVLLGGGGFAYWKYFPAQPPAVIPSDNPVVQDVNVPPEVAPADATGVVPPDASGAGPIGFPSSIEVATTTTGAAESTTTATTTVEATTTIATSSTQ